MRVKNKNIYRIKRKQRKDCGIFLLVLYSCVSILSFFPAFHSHPPSECNAFFCGTTRCCDIHVSRDYYCSTTTELSERNQHEHASKPCAACMWQALTKRSSEPIAKADNIVYMICGRIANFSSAPFLFQCFFLPATRAPPA